MAEQSASNHGGNESGKAASDSQGTPPRFEQLEPIILLNADFTTHSVSSPDQYGQLLFARSLQRESLEHEHGLGGVRVETGAYLPGGGGMGYRDGSGGEGLGALPTLANTPKAAPDATIARERSLQALDRRSDTSQTAQGQPTDVSEPAPSTAPATQPSGNQNSPTNPPTGSGPGTAPPPSGGESTPTPGGFTAPPPGGPWQPTEYRQPGLDLAVIDVQSPATASRGQTITLEWTVRNVGSGSISGDGWHDAVYFSYDATYDASDTYVTSRWTREQNPMSPGSQYTYRREVEIPSAARADGYLLVLTDRWDRVPELTNANNVGASVRINLADAPDVPTPDTTIDPTPPAQPPSGYSPRTDGPGINTPLGTSQIATIEQGLQALRDTFADLAALGDWAASLPLITANDAARTPMTLGRALDLATLFDAQLITPVRTYLSQASPTSDGLVSALDTLSQTFGAVTGGLYNGGTELRFNLDFRSSRTLANLPINLGTEAGPLGLRVDANGQVTMQASVAYSFSFGIDLAAGLGDAEAFFIRSGSLAAAASIAGTNLNFTANVGVLDVSILNGSLAMNAGVSVALTNPDADALGRITLTELQGLSPASLFTVTRTTATATGTLPISATIGGYSFPGAPSITLTANPFSGAAPTLTTNSAFAEMANFKNLSPVQLLSMVDHIGTMLDNLAGTSVMSTPIPFTQGLTVGGALDFAQAFAARVTDALRDPGGVPIFDSVQTFATNLATVLGLPAGTIAPQYDPTENRFSYRLQFSRTAAVQEVPLDFSANLAPLGGVTTSSRLRVTATMNADLRVLFDVDALTSSETIFDAVLIQSASVSGSLSLALSSFSAAARFGFLDVSVGGGSATGNAAISLQMRDPVGGSTTTPVKVTTLLQRIVTDPSSIVTTPSVTGSASMSLGPISVLGGLLGPITGTPTITISLPTLTSTPTLSYNSDFNPILSFRDLDIGDVAGALSSFASYLQTLSGFSFLNYKLPFLNKTVSEMLGFAADFGSIDELVAATGTSALQALQNALNGVLDDLPIPGSATIAFTQTPIRALRIDLSFQDQFNGTQPFNFDLATLASVDGDSLPSTIRNLVSGSGTLNANASVSLDLDLGIDLSNPLNPRPFIYDTTGLALSAQASGTNLNFSVAAGPLGVFIRNGSVNLGPATFSVQVNDNPGGGGRWYLDSIGTGQVTMALTGTANANLPIDFPLEGVSVGAITLSMSNLGNINASTVDLTLPNFQTLINGLDLNLNMSSLVDGLDFVFTIIDGAIVVGGLASRLPIVGDDIGEAVRVIQQFKNNVINPLRTELATGNLLQTEVKSILFSALGPAGINILRDNNNAGGGGVTLDDVIVTVTDTAPADGIVDDIRFDIKIGQEANLSTGQTGFDLGLDAIGLSLDGSVNLQLGWSMNLVFGLSVAEGGAYFDLTNNRNDLTLEASATVPGFDASGRLLILEARARDNPANPTRLNASFQLDLREPPSGNGNGKLSFNELIGATPAQIVNAQFNATAHLDLLLTLRFGPDANFPSLGANLVVDWTMTNASVGSPSVAFNDITVNMGEFFSRFVGPIIEAIQTVTDPLQPVIDALTAPLPVITDLVQLVDPAAEPVTMLTLASLTGLADTQFIGAITDVLDLITIINGISVGPDVKINLGSFNLAGVGASTLRTPGALGSFTIPAANANPLSGLTQLASNPATSSFSTSNQSVEGGGLQFPFLDDPLGSLFPLLLGQDVTIFRYDAPKLAVGFEFRQSFPIIGPLVATLGGRLEAGIDVDFGYDTYGLRRAIETENPLELLNGFYIEDKVGGTASGKDKFEAYITGEIAAGGGIDIFIASAGVEGGVFATIGLDLRDPDGDGKFRFKNIIDAGSPLCVFTLGGEVGAFLRAYVEVGIWPFEVTLSFDLARVTLVTFNYDPCAEPPVLASLESSGELLLNMGPRAGLRGGEFTSDIAERFSVKRLTSYSVLVESDFGEGSQYSQTFGTEANPVLSITADGGAGDDSILIDPGIVLPTNLQGGVGNDTLQGGGANDTIAGGDGTDAVFGNAGADILTGGIGDDSIKGGTGGDTIDGGDGDDVIVGGSDPANPDDNDSILGGLGDDNITGGLGVDTIDAGPGRDIVRGGDGNDILRGGDGPDAVYGDGGDDLIEGGDGDDYLEGGETPVESGAVAPNSGNDTIHGGVGNDEIRGRDGNDTLTGADGDDEMYGDEGDDSIDAGTGDDSAFGGDGADSILLGAGNDSAQGGAGNDVIRGDIGIDTIDAGAGVDQVFGDAGNDTIRGGDDNDTIEGGTGTDFIIGGAGNDTIRGQEDADTLSGQEGNDSIFGGTGNDSIFGGFGNDIIRGEDGADTIYGDTGDDDIRGDAGADTIYGGTGRDSIEGNADADVIRAGEGDDTVRGNAGNDTIYGEAGSDTVYGDDGDDVIEGGDGDDFLRGQIGADNIRGNAGNDFIDGGDGNDTLRGDDNDDLIYGGASGDDIIEGNAGNDRVWGESGTDTVSGGDGDDTLSGGTGNDVISGNAGNDQLLGDEGIDTLSGDTGNDTLVAGSGIGDSLSGGDGDDVIHGSDEGAASDPDFNDAVRFGDLISGGAGNDTIYAMGGADRVSGDGGDDRIDGGMGADLLLGGTDNDALYAGESTGDDLRGEAGDDTIHGSFIGNDTIRGGDGNDVIFGQGGTDTIFGDAGDDIIDAGSGTDIVEGGLGNDEIDGGGGVGDSLSGNEGDDVIRGSDDGADVISGGDGRDRLLGRGGNDTISGGAGDDVIRGGTGDDVISGDAGSDLITGDERHDTLYGHSASGTGDDNAVDYVYGDLGTNGSEPNQGRDQLVGGGGLDQLFGEGDDDVIRQGNAASAPTGPDIHVNYGSGDGATPTDFIPAAPTAAPSVQAGTPLITFGPSMAAGESTAGRFGELAGSGSRLGLSGSAGLSEDAASAAASDGSVYTAWAESQNGSFEIYVARFQGGAWTQLAGSAQGGGISATSGTSRSPSIALDGANPVVAWAETDASGNTNIRVARWNGSAWIALGASLSAAGISGSNLAESPKVVMSGSTPVVAWIDRTGGIRNVHIRRFTGGAWQELGVGSASSDGVSNSAIDVADLSLAAGPTGRLAVAWTQSFAAQDREIYLLEWNGTSWASLGGSVSGGGVSNNASESAQPSLAYLGDTLFVAWQDNTLDRSSILAARFTGGAWQPLGAPLGGSISGSTGRVSMPQLASTGTSLQLAWVDSTVLSRTTTRQAVHARTWNGTSFAEQLVGDARNEGVVSTSGDIRGLHLALDASGRPIVSWTDASAGRPKAFVRHNTFSLGSVYYVNDAATAGDTFSGAAGNAANPGTSAAAPAASVGQILAARDLNPGDVIVVDSGAYPAFTVGADDAGVTIIGGFYGLPAIGGTVAVNAADVTLSGLGLAAVSVGSTSARLLMQDGAATGGITIDGAADATVLRNLVGGGITLNASTTGATIEQNRLSGGARGIHFAGTGVTGAMVRHNTITGATTGIDIAEAAGAEILSNTLTGNATGIRVQAALTGTIAGNTVTGGTVGLRYNAAANVVANTFSGATTGALVSTSTQAAGLGFVGTGAANVFTGGSVGVELNGWMQGQTIRGNTTGVIGTGLLGPESSLDLANRIESNTVGTVFAGVIRFNRIAFNGTAIDASASQVVVHNLIYRNAADGVDIEATADVRIVNNTIDAWTGNAVRARGASSQLEVRGNILWADAGYALTVDNTSQSGFFSDRNTLFSTGTGKIAYWTKDFNDILDFRADVARFDLTSQGRTAVDPLWAQPRFMNRTAGNYQVFDIVAGRRFSSPTVDMGDVTADQGVPVDRVNLLQNPSFESGLSSWTVNLGSSVRTASPAPHAGSGYFQAGNDAAGFAEQTINLLSAGYSPVVLDSQDLVLVFGGRIRSAAESPADRGQFIVRFLDGGGSELSFQSLPASNVSDRWELLGSRVAIPSGARSVVYRFVASRESGSTTDSYLDAGFAYVMPESFGADQGAYGNTVADAAAASTRIVLIAPDLYADWERNRPQTIIWNSFGNAADLGVNIDLFRDGPDGPAFVLNIALNTPDVGSFQWQPGTSGVDFGTYGLRIQVSLSGNAAVVDRGTEAFTVPEDGTTYYVDDASNVNDEYTPGATGNNRATGKLPTAPKPNPVNVIRTYELQNSSTLHVDTGVYPLIDTFVASGVTGAGYGTDRAFSLLGPVSAERVAEFTTAIPGNTTQSLVQLFDADFMQIRRLTLTGGRHAINARSGSTDLTLDTVVARDNAADGVRIEGGSAFTLIRNLTATNHPGSSDGLAVIGGGGGVIENLVASGNRFGLYLNDVGVAINGATLTGNRSFGLYKDGGTAGGTWTGVTATSNAGGGLRTEGNVTIANATITGNSGWGVLQWYSTITVSDSVLSGNTAGGMLVMDGSFTGNRMLNNGGPGIQLQYYSAGSIVGNTFSGNAWGIYADTWSSQPLTIRNNTMSGHANAAIRILNMSGAASRQIVNNTIDEATADGIRVSNSRDITLRNNIVWVRTGYGVYIENDSQLGFQTNFNLLRATDRGRTGFYQGDRVSLTDWQFATFQDADSLSADPLFVNPAAGNFRLQSVHGSYDPSTGTFIANALTSPAIDRGNPADAFNLEPASNGGYINLGAEGNTVQASRSPAQYVTVTNPNGGETLPQNTTFNVRWRSFGFAGNVDIAVSRNGPGGPFTVIAANEANDGSYSWNLTGAPISDQYVLRITSSGTPAIGDASDALFSVGVPISVYYVDDSSDASDEFTPGAVGNDANTGQSPLSPKASIRAVLQQYDLEFGDVIYVDTGTYQLTANILIEAQDAGVRIVGPSSGPGAVIDRNNRTSASQRAFELVNADAVTISRLRITGAFYGVFVGDGSSDVTLDNVELFENADRGIQVNDNASANFTLRDSYVWGNAADGNRNQDYGTVIHGVNSTVLRNRFTKINGRDGYGLYIDAPGTAIVQDNQAWNNTHG
ncbi:MAG: Bifunctional hemolysin/adenylate cyclase precursor, partial [Planctomycetota bacterium]